MRMDDTVFKQKYKKYKLRVKLWENDFKKKHGRVPSKYDIREASKEIRDSYKMYYKLKTSYLEDTLNEALADDGFDILEISQSTNCGDFILDDDEADGCSSFNGGPHLPHDITAILDQSKRDENEKSFSNIDELANSSAAPVFHDENKCSKSFMAVEELKSNQEAWGESVSKKISLPSDKSADGDIKEKATLVTLKSNLNTKLFNKSSFSKRNPRKSLSRLNSDISNSQGARNLFEENSRQTGQELLPDLETILTQKAKEQQAASNSSLLSSVEVKVQQGIKTQLDEGWLARNANENGGSKSVKQQNPIDNKTKSQTVKTYGLSNVDVSKILPSKTDETPPTTSTDHVQRELNMKPILENADNNDVPIEEVNFHAKNQHAYAKSDSDSVVSDSDDEEKIDKYQQQRIKRRRLLPTISESVAPTKSALEEPINDSSKEISANADLIEKDFSADENDADPSYVPEEKPKTARKKAVPKRKKTEAIDMIDDSNKSSSTANDTQNNKRKRRQPRQSSQESSATAKPTTRRRRTKPSDDEDMKKNDNPQEFSTANDDKPTTTTTTTKRRVRKSTKDIQNNDLKESSRAAKKPTKRRTRKLAQDGDEDDNDNEAALDRPPSPGQLKCALALDGGHITSVPRATTTELDMVDVVVNRYINTIPSSSSSSMPTLSNKKRNENVRSSVVDEKRSAARRILEGKINAGKLNENFVRINIEKKRYSRGKKGINYSKYKKTLWKNKKRIAALTGPDMDMRGCDGGALKCFTCGQVGHFAQNCKMKGDTLLPLSSQIEEDPSPFPTLEEVAKMASASATVVHSRNITKLPEATNVALLYNNIEGEGGEGGEGEENEECTHDDEELTSHNKDDLEVDDIAIDNFDFNDDDDDDDDDQFRNIDIDALEREAKDISPVKKFVGHKIPEDFLKKAGLIPGDIQSSQNIAAMDKSNPLYDLNEDGSIKDVTPEVMDALHMFGHTNFRKGQDRAVMRILSGQSTLVTLSTGSGKSLCYQLPAYLYSRKKGLITLVISPLVSLMEDQVTGVPHFLRAHCLHTNQTKPQRAKIMQMISNGEVDILLVSPEAVVAGERSTGFGAILRDLPAIAFACIDEAHCVSQWSHNFRPSYLMICKVLKKNLGVKTILGLTATATLPTRISIIDHLGITDGETGIISDIPLPDNLILSVSKDENRDSALLQLLSSERFDKCQSIIVYCTRREECERIAGFLRTCLKDRNKPENDGKKKRKRVSWEAEPYHAGMPASRRRTVQNTFMKNELRIVVATIAFGMGINKPDIRAIIHYNMPKNFESYVQEIGRAGRDGKPSYCHLFLDANGNDQNELRRHIFANSIDRHVIRRLLQNIFIPCSCATKIAKSDDGSNNERGRERACPGHEIGIPIEETVYALDIPEENISTLLCYLELDTRWNLNVLSSAYMKAKVISYGGAKYLKHAARDCPPLAMAIALQLKRNTFKEDSNIIEFPVVDIAAAIGWNSGVVKHQLKTLEWTNVNGYPQRSPITVQFIELGFRVKAPGDFTAEEIDEALDTLHERSVRQEKTQLIQLQYVFQGLSSVAYNSYLLCSKIDFPLDRSEQLKAIIRDYFKNDHPKDLKLEINTNSTPDEHIIDDINGLINMYPENEFNGRTIARIFYGISSPNYPAVMWGRCKYWRAHCKSDFNRIIRLANATIVKRRT